MGRTRRQHRHHRYQHVTNRGTDRRDVFLSDEDRVGFGQLLGEAHDRTGVDVVAYCLMTNHFHLVLDSGAGSMPDFMHHLGAQFARHWHLRHGGDGPVFSGRYASRSITDEGYLLSAVRYVHRNPLAFLDEPDLIGYRWSSLRAYAGFRRPPRFLQMEPVLTWTGGRDQMLRSTLTSADHGGVIIDPDELRRAIIQVLASGEHPTDLTRSVNRIALVAAGYLTDDPRRRLERQLVPASGAATDRAIRRAAQEARSRPQLSGIAVAALELLGTRSSGAGSQLTR